MRHGSTPPRLNLGALKLGTCLNHIGHGNAITPQGSVSCVKMRPQSRAFSRGSPSICRGLSCGFAIASRRKAAVN